MEAGRPKATVAGKDAASPAPVDGSQASPLGDVLPRIVVIVGVVLTAAAYWAARGSAQYRLQSRFEHGADLGIHLIRDSLQGTIRGLDGTRRFLEWQNPPTPQAFTQYTEDVARQPGLLGIAWAPRVAAGDRAAFEAAARLEGLAEYRIHAPGRRRTDVETADPPAGEAAPLRFIAPERLQARFAGLDLLAVRGLGEAVRAAFTNARVQVAPSGIDENSTNSFTRFAAVMPVRAAVPRTPAADAAPSSTPPAGFLIGLFSVHDLVRHALEDAECENLVFNLVDNDYDGTGKPVLCQNRQHRSRGGGAEANGAEPEALDLAPGLLREADFEFAGRTWCIQVHATAAFVADNRPGWPTWIPILGLALTALAGWTARQAAAHDHTARQRREHHERRLRVTEERLALTIRGADLGTWDWNVASGDVILNDRWFEMLGYQPGEIRAHVSTWEQLVHPEDLPHVKVVLADHLEGRTPQYQSEHRLRHKSGRWVWVLDRGAVFERDASGQPLRACGTHLDITARKEAEKALARFALSSESLRKAITALHRSNHRAATFETLLDEALELTGACGGAVGSVDRTGSRLHFFTHRGFPEELVSALDLIDPLAPALRPLLDTKGGLSVLAREPLLPGNPTDSPVEPQHFSALAIDDGKHGAALLLLGYPPPAAPDPALLETLPILAVEAGAVLRRLAIEAELRGSQERLQLSLHAARLGVWEWEATTHEISWSPLCLEILGVDRFDGRTETVRQWIHPEDAPGAWSSLLHALESRASFTTEVRTLATGGAVRWISVVARGVHHPDGRLARVVGILQDLTERHRIEEQLREVQRLEGVGQLAGGIAHEFNNILAAILLNQTLIDDGSHSGIQQESLSEIRSLTHRAANLVRQLLAFSQKATLDPATLELNELLATTSRLLDPLLGEAIQTRLLAAPGPVYVRADRRLLEQVLVNLGLNARDAMPQGGQLTLSLRTQLIDDAEASRHPGAKAGRHACLAVVDDGIGMEDAVLQRLFQPFFTTKEVGRGTGLGLATAHGIVRQHRGWIRVASKPGAGSTFEVFLPSIESPDPASPPLALPDQAASPTILLVEDEASLRRAATMLLRRLGYVVLDAGSPAQARALWAQHGGRIGLLLTDLVLPGGSSGTELAAEFRRQNPHLRIIVSSGYNLGNDRLEDSLPEGALFLPKPSPPAAIEAAVRSVLPLPA